MAAGAEGPLEIDDTLPHLELPASLESLIPHLSRKLDIRGSKRFALAPVDPEHPSSRAVGVQLMHLVHCRLASGTHVCRRDCARLEAPPNVVAVKEMDLASSKKENSGLVALRVHPSSSMGPHIFGCRVTPPYEMLSWVHDDRQCTLMLYVLNAYAFMGRVMGRHLEHIVVRLSCGSHGRVVSCGHLVLRGIAPLKVPAPEHQLLEMKHVPAPHCV